MQPYTIQTFDLRYSFGSRPVLRGLDLQVPQGSIYGFLGPNGAGKTTTIRALLGLLQEPAGKVQLFGQDLRQHRMSVLQRVGSLIESPSLYRHLSGRDNLEVLRRQLGLPQKRIDEVLEIVRLTADAHRRVNEYSLGMGQRLGIALALLSDPQLLVLDEPTNGLDPMGIKEIRELLKMLHTEFGKTIFLSSHLLSEIERSVTHVGIVRDGELLFQGTVPELQQFADQRVLLALEVEQPWLAQEILARHQFTVQETEDGWLSVALQQKAEAAVVNQLLVEQGLAVFRLQPQRQTLEDLFLHLTADQPTPHVSLPS